MSGATVTITGNITSDPELRYTQTGVPVANFTVAHTPRSKNPTTGEWEDSGDTLFLRVTAWRELAENVAASLSKGDAVMVIGLLGARTWQTKEGDNRTDVVCAADSVAVDLRRQTVGTVIRIRKGGQPQEPVQEVWSPAAADSVPA